MVRLSYHENDGFNERAGGAPEPDTAEAGLAAGGFAGSETGGGEHRFDAAARAGTAGSDRAGPGYGLAGFESGGRRRWAHQQTGA